MTDTDRLLSTGARVLTDGCSSCNMSKVYCRCVAWIEGDPARCCDTCSHSCSGSSSGTCSAQAEVTT